LLRPGALLETLRPFLDTAPYNAVAIKRPERGPVTLLAVGMMRHGAKRKSYAVLASALKRLADRRDWCLEIVGDGEARGEVEADLAFLGDRVRFVGAVDQEALIRHYAAADLLVWPAIEEAYGMALLEAQASGLPVVAGDAGGVAAIVRDGETGRLVPAGDPDAFAAAVRSLLDEPGKRRRLGTTAARLAVAEHDLTVARDHIQALLAETVARCR
jgi:glycosyltransferase involved in cell wall biosynthesis